MADRTDELPRIDNLDGFRNELTGLGDPTRDKRFGGRTNGPSFDVVQLVGVEAESRWRGSDLGARIVEDIPDAMTREGFELTVQPSEDDERADDAGDATRGLSPTRAAPMPTRDTSGQEIAEAVDKALLEMRALSLFRDALCYERAYGGSGVLIGADDSGGPRADMRLDADSAKAIGRPTLDADDPRNLTQPLDETRIKSLRWLNVFRGGFDGELSAYSYYDDPRSPRYGEPRIYALRSFTVPPAQVAPGELRAPVRAPMLPTLWIHESRLLIFPGQTTSREQRVRNQGWGDSVFTRVDRVLADFDMSWSGVANLLQDWAQGVFKMKGLASLLASGDAKKQGVIAQRSLALHMSRSIARVLMLDSEEEFSRETTSLAGLSEVLQQFSLRLAAAADMPVTLLMGQAPSGLNATGASDVRFFYDRIAAKQRERLLPHVRRLDRLVMLSKDGPTRGQEPQKWAVVGRPLWQLTSLEEATLRKTQADTDAIYLAQGVVTPEEITASRFGGAAWSAETVIDFEGRAAMAAIEEPEAPEPGADDPTAAPAATATATRSTGQALDLTPSAQGAIVKVNEARAKLGYPPLTTAGGALDPDGNLTIAEFTAKRSAVVAEAAKAESGVDPNKKPAPVPAALAAANVAPSNPGPTPPREPGQAEE